MCHRRLPKLVSLLLLSSSLWTCSDHRSRPVDPLQVRLKVTDGIPAGTTPSRTEYTYDQQNRLLLSTRPDGRRRTFSYDQLSRYQLSEYTPGSSSTNSPQKGPQRTKFIYNQNSRNFIAETYVLQNGIESLVLLSYYSFDAANHLIQVRKTDPVGNLVRLYRYEYTGDNITTEVVGEESRFGRTPLTYFYTYDDKPNPYYGLVAPDDDFTEVDNRAGVRRYSRNNITKITFVTIDVVSRYVYNSQGLTVSVTDSTSGRGVTAQGTFTYEPY
jgi:hypothetical protein